MHALLRGKQMHVVVALAPVWYMTLKEELRSNKQSDILSTDSSINDSSIISTVDTVSYFIVLERSVNILSVNLTRNVKRA